MDRTKCPKDGKKARRVYVQVSNPNNHRSTSVALPFVYCGEAGYRMNPDGKTGFGFVTPGKDGHGLVPLDVGTFTRQRTRSHALVSRLKEGSRKGGKPSKSGAAKPSKTKKPGKGAAKKTKRPTAQRKLGESPSEGAPHPGEGAGAADAPTA